jgi:hypothetical protein
MVKFTVPTLPVAETPDIAMAKFQPELLPALTWFTALDACHTAPPVALESLMVINVAVTVPLA